MSSLTTRLSLKRPDGTDPFLRQDFVDNYNKLDAAPGIHICTSGSLPTWGAGQVGRAIYETDVNRVRVWNGTAFRELTNSDPGISSYTTVQIAALSGSDLWPGRIVWDSTLGTHRAYNGSSWVNTAYSPHTHTQAESHLSADTDVATSSLHHTLGTGSKQAAAGNHTHSYTSQTYWTGWTPVLQTTNLNFSMGNAVVDGAYVQTGNLVYTMAYVQIGSTTSIGTGNILLKLPVPSLSYFNGQGQVVVRKSGTNYFGPLFDYATISGYRYVKGGIHAVNGELTQNLPVSYTAGTEIYWSATYFVA